MNSTTAAIEMEGMPKRKENFAASFLSQPATKAVEIVTPDLEKPGIIAKAWERPIKKPSKYLWFFKFIEPFFEISAKYMKKAMRIETNAIDKFDRRILSKKIGANSFIVPPQNIIGMVPINIDLNNFTLNKYKKKFFEFCFFNLKKSFLK